MTVLAAPAIILTAAVTLLAVLIAIAFAILVARTRRAVRIAPPAMTGDARLERALRIQGNTVESLIAFLPSLWLAALYFPGWWAPVIGLAWCLGRILYAIGYRKDAERRHPGFAVSMIAILLLVILAAIGLVQAWMASGA